MISRAQLLDLGLGGGAIEHRLRTGRLLPFRWGVYSVGVAPPTREGRWAAALLACGPGAVLSHITAAVVWELRAVDPPTVDVTVPRRGARPRAGIRVHRPRRLEAQDATQRRGLPVTTVSRTLMDLAEVLSTRELQRALDEAAFLKRLRRGEVRPSIERNSTRTGAKRLARLLARHEPGTTRTATELEEAFYLLVARAGLLQPEVNVPVGPFVVDFLWRDHRLVVETDGGGSHDRPSQRRRDARRDAWLAARDYTTLRFTWEQVHNHAEEVLAALQAKLGNGVRAG